jgi:hypothetical protein
MNLSEHYLFTKQNLWQASMTDNQRFDKARKDLLSKVDQLDREASTEGKSEFLSLSKFALALGSVLVATYGVIHFILV